MDTLNQNLRLLHARAKSYHSTSLHGHPTPYLKYSGAAIAKTPTDQVQIPHPAVFSSLEPGHDNVTGLPTAAECAVHLELLEAFFALRHRVLLSVPLDKVFNTEPAHRVVHAKEWEGRHKVWREKVVKDRDYPKKRKARWEADFLPLAVARFRVWTGALEGELTNDGGKGDVRNKLMLPHLPPLGGFLSCHGRY
jgi:hypothetical protein